MKFFEKVRKIGKRAKLAISTAVASAMSVAAMACVASAAETGEAGTADMNTVLAEAGTQLTSSFNSLVSTMIPVILGILGSGLVIFGLFALIKLAKKVFSKVAG